MSGTSNTNLGRALVKSLGIKLQYRDPLGSGVDSLTRGESTFSLGTADTYVELEPSSAEWVREHIPSRHQVGLYFYNLFPFLKWIGRYNWQWFVGDIVAGE